MTWFSILITNLFFSRIWHTIGPKVEFDQSSISFWSQRPKIDEKELNLKWMENKKKWKLYKFRVRYFWFKNENGSAKFNIYRVGYSSEDKATVPFKTVLIPSRIINKENQYEKHTIISECNFGIFEFWIDKKDADHKLKVLDVEPTSRFAPRGLNLNPVGVAIIILAFRWLQK